MTEEQHSPAGATLTELILEIFRLNGRLLAAGDGLAESVGLSSARWQVLGAIHLAPQPQTVSWLSRSMGLTRQAVQRIVNELENDGLVAFRVNPAHRRAQLVVLTRKGQTSYAAVDRRQKPWANALARGLERSEIRTALGLLATIRARLEVSTEDT